MKLTGPDAIPAAQRFLGFPAASKIRARAGTPLESIPSVRVSPMIDSMLC